MPSSNKYGPLKMLPGMRFPGLGGVLLAACLALATSSQGATSLALAACTVADGAATPRDSAPTLELRRSVEKSPLFTVQAASAGVASCRIRYESAVIGLEYQFKNGGWLRVKRDARIEYTNHEAHFASPPAENPVTVLIGAERAAFGPNGCGIDWQETETLPVEASRTETETVYRGEVCNCQARIRRDAAGRVIGFTLRSTC